MRHILYIFLCSTIFFNACKSSKPAVSAAQETTEPVTSEPAAPTIQRLDKIGEIQRLEINPKFLETAPPPNPEPASADTVKQMQHKTLPENKRTQP
jgi:hypothetical protein